MGWTHGYRGSDEMSELGAGNPYEAPRSTASGAETFSGTGDEVSALVVDELRRTKPWARLCGILGFVLGGLYVVMGIVVVGVMGISGGAGPEGGAMEIAAVMGMAMVYWVFAGLVIYPSMKLVRYAGRIGRLFETKRTEDLVEALVEQRKFWFYVGILAVIGLVFSVLGMMLVVAGGIFAGAAAAG
ncbi:MAG: DUF5362 family protein [Verrucomicrobiota bacterium]